ncbi:ATP-binding cassette domain-containing protein [Mycetocola tolaasinivorans]|uniref:ATP-binding cassette domain-containing protein n=1 Tax=Mycetocola tolaasinivorans TaxID=76635 RepID=A0A3L7A4Q8_9MICO|nr:ATP-binding cassette domain-containing protein [Mycetocola tolaasinivorans]RLP74928.1 ATP-binding cassette domain-containing protein [Mycetocola tolaasinivorans]
MTSTVPIILDDLSKRYGTRVLWQGLSATLNPGEIAAVTGPSGSGKSTLLNAIGLLENASAGRILVGDHDLTRLRFGQARRFRRDTLGYLFQNFALVGSATASTNIRLGLVRSPGRELLTRSIGAALERVGLAGRERTPVFQLSGGEQQRVALARLIVKNPRIILADEPTASLDAGNEKLVLDVLRERTAEGAIVLIATHSAALAAAADRTLTLAPPAGISRG